MHCYLGVVLCRAMTNFNNMCPIEAVFMEYDFRRFTRMVDVGGGLGAFAAAALAAAPKLEAHLFDQPNVMQQAQQVRSASLDVVAATACTSTSSTKCCSLGMQLGIYMLLDACVRPRAICLTSTGHITQWERAII